MGLCHSSGDNAKLTPEEREKAKMAKARSKALERKAEQDRDVDSEVFKLLLLGAGESGKSTLFKQMVSIYGAGPSEAERRAVEPIIYNNVITSVQMLITQSPKWGKGTIGCPASVQVVTALNNDSAIDDSNRNHLKALWADPVIQETYLHRSHFQLLDSAVYFFDKLDQLGVAGYMPSDQDILRCRVRTTGIVEQEFHINGEKFRLFDVGGQRNERKKWIHCFEGVTAVLFVGVLSEYDLTLYEDETMNRMEETLNIFDEICNSAYFTKTSIILFLNKRDIFQEKIRTVALNSCPCFKSYTGPNTYEAGCQLIENSFHARNKNPNKLIYAHVTCATDTNNMKVVLNAVNDIIIRGRLGAAGFV